MNTNTCNNSSNSNWYATLADKDKDLVGSLHTISDNSIGITTVQAIAEEVEVQQLELEIEQKLELLDTHINQVSKQVSKTLSTLVDTDVDKLNFKEKDKKMTALPVPEMEEKFKDKLIGFVMRADVQLFMDQVGNLLATASHPHHSGGCAHLLDNEEHYCERVGDNKASLPKATVIPTMPKLLGTTSAV